MDFLASIKEKQEKQTKLSFFQNLLKKEILKLQQYTTRDSYTLVPLSLYFSGSNVKMEVGLCKGKKLWDKRESDAKAEAGREIERATKSRGRHDYDD
jgi:SsrA-binding protein